MKLTRVLFTFFVFLTSCWIGLSVAQQKPLWYDEIMTERHFSYKDLILGNSDEGTKAPVYYCFQKVVDQVFSYQVPQAVIDSTILAGQDPQKASEDLEKYSDKKAQVVCRISSILWMSLSIALIFYYFLRTAGFMAGVAAWLITLSTFMVWCYWAEDRAYSFWFLLTSIQSLTVLWFSQNNQKKSTVFGVLILTNILLSLTVATTIVQVIAISIWMFWVGYRKITDYILTVGIPFLICLFYFKQAPNFLYGFLFPAWKMITANIPIERIAVLLAASIYMWMCSRSVLEQKHKGDLKFLFYFGFIFMAAVCLLLAFKMKEGHPPEKNILYLNGRHLIFLAPTGIIALSFLFTRSMQLINSKKVRIILILTLLVLTVPRIWKYSYSYLYIAAPEISSGMLRN